MKPIYFRIIISILNIHFRTSEVNYNSSKSHDELQKHSINIDFIIILCKNQLQGQHTLEVYKRRAFYVNINKYLS